MFASCGLEREVVVWAANSGRRIGSLTGHTASIAHICLDDNLNQVFTLANDKVGGRLTGVLSWRAQVSGRQPPSTGSTDSAWPLQHPAPTRSCSALPPPPQVIKVWDLRTHKCLQTIGEDDWARKDTNSPASITYDAHRRRLISAQHHPYIWGHKMTSLDKTGHREPLKGGRRVAGRAAAAGAAVQ